MDFKRFVQHSVRRLGYDLWYFDRMRLLRRHGINLLFDVGANVGDYGRDMRAFGYRGRIASFEPMQREFKLLAERASKDPLWNADNCALGDRDGTAEIHVAANSESSSLLEILPRHVSARPESRYTGTEVIRIAKLDSVFQHYWKEGDRVLLKLDTQGYDYRVIQGSMKSLPLVSGIQVELSLVPLYGGASGLSEMVQILADFGFTLMAVEAAFRDQTIGQMLQIDGIFYRDQPTL
jgi:FkbM family methyltransferase